MQQSGYDPALGAETAEVLLHIDRIQPGQQRFAQLMEQLSRLVPVTAVAGSEPVTPDIAAEPGA
jgi:acetolactate synthase small subunit